MQVKHCHTLTCQQIFNWKQCTGRFYNILWMTQINNLTSCEKCSDLRYLSLAFINACRLLPQPVINWRLSLLLPAVVSTLVWGKHVNGPALFSHPYALLSLSRTLCLSKHELLNTCLLWQVLQSISRTYYSVQGKKKSWTNKIVIVGTKKEVERIIFFFLAYICEIISRLWNKGKPAGSCDKMHQIGHSILHSNGTTTIYIIRRQPQTWLAILNRCHSYQVKMLWWWVRCA